MFFVIGLGNPESRYSETRHNVGFKVVEHLSRELRFSFKAGRGQYLIAQGVANDRSLALIKPLTYMNESGLAVMEIREEFESTVEQLLVVCDDFQLSLGQLRLRLQGSDGGHNGLYSIIYHLQSDEFPRLRCGIASSSMPTNKNLMADFVLEKFSADENPVVQQMIKNAADACLLAHSEGMTAAMNAYNRKEASEEDSTIK
jgi:peptidyl-tRNA hydrolase, PTH1 family